jgi:hypothetical protein
MIVFKKDGKTNFKKIFPLKALLRVGMHRQYFCRMYLKVMGVSEDAGINPRTVAKVSLDWGAANF